MKCFLFLVLMAVNCQFVFAQEPAASNAGREENPGGETDRRWGFAASLSGSSTGQVAVSKKLSKHTMLLLEAAFSFDDTGRENSAGTSSYSTNDRTLSLSIGPEWRRYHFPASRDDLAFYWGIQPMFGRSSQNSESTTTPSSGTSTTNKTEYDNTFYGANLTFGIEYEAIEPISLSVHFRPFRYQYSKQDRNNSSDSSIRWHRLTISQAAALYVRIYF